MKRRFRSARVAAAATLGLSSMAFAGQSWVGGGPDTNWTTGSNWDGGGNPTSGSYSNLYFDNYNGNYQSNNNYSGWVPWGYWYFSAGGAFTLTSNSDCYVDLYGGIENWSWNPVYVHVPAIAANADVYFNPWYGDLTIAAQEVFTNGRSIKVTAEGGQTLRFDWGTTIRGGKLKISGNSNVVFYGNQLDATQVEIDTGTFQVGYGYSGTAPIFVGNGGTDYANRDAALLMTEPYLTIGNNITTNKADTGSGAGTGIRFLGGTFTSGVGTYSGAIDVNGGLRLTAGEGGTVVVDGVIRNGSDSGNVSRNVTVEGRGTVRLRNANTYSGTTNISTGTLQIGTSAAVFNAGNGAVQLDGKAGSAGVLDLNGYTQGIGTLNGAAGAAPARILNGAVGTSVFLEVGYGNASGAFAGNIINNTGSGGVITLRKYGTGVQTLSGVNTYTGATRVFGGTLLMNGTHTGGGDYEVLSTGRLGGRGVISLASGKKVQVDPGGTVTPGASVGSLTVNGAFTLVANNTATIEVEVGGDHTKPGVAFDLLVVNGALTINGGRLNVVPTGTLELLQEYKIISATSYNPTGNVFGKLNDMIGSNNYTNSPLNNFQYTLYYRANDGIYLKFTAVPEPAIFAGALTGLCLLRPRRRK